MSMGRINKISVDSAKAGEKDWLLWDDKISGFGLKVTPSGGKVFVFQYRLGGRGTRVRRYTIGKFGRLTADHARKEAGRLAILVSQGVDPQTEKAVKARQSVDLAFRSYAKDFVDDCLKVRWKSSYAGGEAHLRLYATPILGNKPLPEITRADINAVLKPVRNRIATASYLYAVLRRLFRWAVSQGDLKVSPLVGMEPPPLPAKRDRVLDDNQLALVWKASNLLGYPFGPLIRLLVLTGQRREEVAGLSWSELDRAKAMWALPAKRAKNGLATRVPLSDRVILELGLLAKRSGKVDGWPTTGFVFSTTGKTSVSGYSRAKSRLDDLVKKEAKKQGDGSEMAPWRLHDLRRTLATGMQRLGVRFEVTEAIMNHVSGSRAGVAGIYQLHDWGPEKATALQAWSNHITALEMTEDRSNVLQLGSVRA